MAVPYGKDQSLNRKQTQLPPEDRPKLYTCKICKKKYESTGRLYASKLGRPHYKTCNKIDCVAKAATQAYEKVKQSKAKLVRKENKDHKDKLKKEWGLDKPKADYLQTQINKIIHFLDADKPCMANPLYSDNSFDAGHIIPISRYKCLSYNLLNIHKQGKNSNSSQKDDLRMMYGAEIRYGKEFRTEVEGLPLRYPILKLSKDDKKEKLKIVNEILRELDKGRIDISDGLQVRRDLNTRIGIYL